jgi:predicted transcriptional regulator
MFESWEETSTPKERVRTIAETLVNPSTVEEIAKSAKVDHKLAEDMISELLSEGVLERHKDRYSTSEAWALASEIRQLGEETEDGILVRYDVLREMESGQSEE